MPLNVPSVYPLVVVSLGSVFAFFLHLMPLTTPNPPWLLVVLLCGLGRFRYLPSLTTLTVLCWLLDLLTGAPLGFTALLYLPPLWLVRFGAEAWSMPIGGLPLSVLAGLLLHQILAVLATWWSNGEMTTLSVVLGFVVTILAVRMIGYNAPQLTLMRGSL